MSKCIHNHCLDCGDMCPICGDNPELYNLGEKNEVCRVGMMKESAKNYKEDIFVPKQLPHVFMSGSDPKPDKNCPVCGKNITDMTAVEKDRYFIDGRCCDGQS